MTENNPTKYQAGMQAQQQAENYLINKGYSILERNYRIRTGEVDIIAKHNSYVIFVEVKFRRGASFGLPREAVGNTKQRRIVHTAMHYISVRNINDRDFRFDVVEVTAKNGQVQINHIENAFDAY